MKTNDEGLLGHMRVLDLTDRRGYLGGRILGDLGADVLKIEPPGGDPGRKTGPFYHDIPHPEKSLYWFAYNANKRGITLNIENRGGKALFLRMVSTADVVIESFPAGHMKNLGLNYEELEAVNPQIILTSVSPFGQTGPYSRFKGSDIVLMSMGGFTHSCGDPERAPLNIGFPQSDLFAGLDAALGTMIAYYHRESTGEGQHVDIAAQASIFWTAGPLTHWTVAGNILKREGQFRGGLSASARQRQIWKCKDGFVTFQIYGGQVGAKTNRNLVRWMDEEGMANDFLRALDWGSFDMASLTQDLMDMVEQPVAAFFMNHTKAELEDEAVKRDVVLYLVCTMADEIHSPQPGDRKYFIEVEHPELEDSITYPGAWVNLANHEWKLRFRAPLIGEHNREFYCGELSISKKELVMMKSAGVI